MAACFVPRRAWVASCFALMIFDGPSDGHAGAHRLSLVALRWPEG